MSVTLVNSHVLIPHLPDWGSRVAHQRRWQSEVGRGVSGGEHRVALRQRPRLSLSWSLVPNDSEEQAQMHARLRAARKSGYGCAPYWGRGIHVSSTSGADLTLADSPWAFLEADDYVLIRGLDVTDPEGWEVAQVAAFADPILTMTASLGTAWGTEAWCWPLLFGKFECGDLSHRSDWHTSVKCSLSQLVTRPYVATPSGPDLCTIIDADSGDSFECYVVGSVGPFVGGNGWASSWNIYVDDKLLQDKFDYIVGGTPGAGGQGWAAGGWIIHDQTFRLDDFEDYVVGDPPGNAGSGWSGAWVIYAAIP